MAQPSGKSWLWADGFLTGCVLNTVTVLTASGSAVVPTTKLVVLRKGIKGPQCHEDGDHVVSSLPIVTLTPYTYEPDKLLNPSSRVHVPLADRLACPPGETNGTPTVCSSA